MTSNTHGPVLWDVDARGVATVTLNRPEVNNAYYGAKIDGLLAALDALGDAPGLRAVVLKESASDVVFKGIQAVMSGEYWVGRKAVSTLGVALKESAALFPAPAPKHFGLTSREREIVGEILTGCSNSDIAAKFSISEKTVKHHLTNIFDKLGVSSRLELALFALHYKLDLPASTAAPRRQLKMSLRPSETLSRGRTA